MIADVKKRAWRTAKSIRGWPIANAWGDHSLHTRRGCTPTVFPLNGWLEDDRSDEILVKAMSSEFFFARMEAALHLAKRKHKTSVGQIESLMYRVPPPARFFFRQFVALIGTSDAVSILRHLMEDNFVSFTSQLCF